MNAGDKLVGPINLERYARTYRTGKMVVLCNEGEQLLCSIIYCSEDSVMLRPHFRLSSDKKDGCSMDWLWLGADSHCSGNTKQFDFEEVVRNQMLVDCEVQFISASDPDESIEATITSCINYWEFVARRSGDIPAWLTSGLKMKNVLEPQGAWEFVIEMPRPQSGEDVAPRDFPFKVRIQRA